MFRNNDREGIKIDFEKFMHVPVYTCMTRANNSNVYKNWIKNTGEGWYLFNSPHNCFSNLYIKLFY